MVQTAASWCGHNILLHVLPQPLMNRSSMLGLNEPLGVLRRYLALAALRETCTKGKGTHVEAIRTPKLAIEVMT